MALVEGEPVEENMIASFGCVDSFHLVVKAAPLCVRYCFGYLAESDPLRTLFAAFFSFRERRIFFFSAGPFDHGAVLADF